MIGLWRLANGEGFAQIGERFGVGCSSARRCTTAFCAAMVQEPLRTAAFTELWPNYLICVLRRAFIKPQRYQL
jgi:hypothetical protein